MLLQLSQIAVRFQKKAVSSQVLVIRFQQSASERVPKDPKHLTKLQAVGTAVEMVKNEKNGGAVPVPDYIDINISDKVVKIIQSYTGVVNKMVWRKDV